VDELPVEQRNPRPDYPREAVNTGQQGRVKLLVTVATDGTVSAASVEVSSGYPLLDEAALRAVRKWIFIPGRRNGQKVVSQVIKPFDFSINNPD
jgi:protein TonB